MRTNILQIEPQLQSGKHVMVAAHGNSLRSIIMYLDKLTSQEVATTFISLPIHLWYDLCSLKWINLLLLQVINLELSTGIPLLYIYKEGRFMKRGSPVGPTEAGVFAYTEVWLLTFICPIFWVVLRNSHLSAWKPLFTASFSCLKMPSRRVGQ